MPRKLTWLHISDIHFFPRNEWRDSVSRRSLLTYLRDRFAEDAKLKPDIVFCTGDIAFGEAGKSSLDDQYEDAKRFFDELLLTCGDDTKPLPRDRLFVVPGNHDINRKAINLDAQAALFNKSGKSHQHAAEINDRFSNKTLEFDDAFKRLEAYTSFVADYLPHQVDVDGRNVYQSRVRLDGMTVEVCGFNSAWTAAGPEDDRNLWLAASAQFALAARDMTPYDIRIGLIHHPVDWFNPADRKVATSNISSSFDFWLHGHSHDSWILPTGGNITIGAGALGAEDSAEFGINLTQVDIDQGMADSHLFSKLSTASGWTIHPIHTQAPNGIWSYPLPRRTIDRKVTVAGAIASAPPAGNNQTKAAVTRKLTAKLDYCLKSYSTQPIIWIEPVVSRLPETSRHQGQEGLVELDEIITTNADFIIVAPPQFGLTSLCRQLALRAWRDYGKLLLYVDFQNIKGNKAAVSQVIKAELDELEQSVSWLGGLVIDGGSDNKEFAKSIRVLAGLFPHIPIICSYQLQNVLDPIPSVIGEVRTFSALYLWSLSRAQIRQVVASYNLEKYVGEEDVVTTRLSSDLDVLNLHRTPLSCLTLLKVSEADFDENPVNRSEMIKRILFLIFNVDAIPTYKSRPDLKDCEFVLGYFCQQLIQKHDYVFSRAQFISDIQRFCQQQLISLEIHVVFDVLFANNIIVSSGSQFTFKFSYWVLYFAAQRMHHDEAFAAFVLSDIRYSQFPEIIEFYTGIDRKRDEALRSITRDLLAVVEAVKRTCGLPDDLNPYRLDIWKATPVGERAMQDVVANGVKESTLPDAIKDHYADLYYDRTRPYNQRIANFLTENNVAAMFRIIRAAARALRNSDYASTDVKRALLASILVAWEQASRVVLVILPALSVDGNAVIDGQQFKLQGLTVKDPEEAALLILKAIPRNVAVWFKDDIYSPKMSPLFFERFDDISMVQNDLSRHELALLLIQKRPKDWEKTIHRYIAGLRKDSYYLLDTYQVLQQEYKYGYASRGVLRDIEFLIKMAAAKHTTGAKDPGIKVISKLKFSDGVVPQRIVLPEDRERP